MEHVIGLVVYPVGRERNEREDSLFQAAPCFTYLENMEIALLGARKIALNHPYLKSENEIAWNYRGTYVKLT